MFNSRRFVINLVAVTLFLISGVSVGADLGWYDGERWRGLHEDPAQIARLELHDEVTPDGSTLRLRSVRLQSLDEASSGLSMTANNVIESPVFRDHPRGPIRVAIGGVIVQLNSALSVEEKADWLVANGLRAVEESERLGWIMVASPPGYPSIELANRLHKLPDVEFSSPNWWQPRTRR
jgi:hypothetical protein